MKPQTEAAEALRALNAERLDVSARGSGLNAVWRIHIEGVPAILKTYDARRSAWKTFLLLLEHAVAGKTPYTAAGRCRTERTILTLWQQAQLDVPALIAFTPPPGLSIPHLCLEYVDGRLLSDVIADAQGAISTNADTIARLAQTWGRRHELALTRNDPRFIQEHASWDHVLLTDSRLVTFDLEVSFRSWRPVAPLIAREICSGLYSILKRLTPEDRDQVIRLFVDAYPHRDLLHAACRHIAPRPNRPARRGRAQTAQRLQRCLDTVERHED